MRERIARFICALTLAVVVVLAWRFAAEHNRAATLSVASKPGVPARTETSAARVERATPRPPDSSADKIERGRAVYAEQRCAACHAIGGEGNPRHPLDDVGLRRDANALADWIAGTGEAADLLPASTLRRKRAYRDLAAAESEALVSYLASLRAAADK